MEPSSNLFVMFIVRFCHLNVGHLRHYLGIVEPSPHSRTKNDENTATKKGAARPAVTNIEQFRQ
jgi:hypothetical protein